MSVCCRASVRPGPARRRADAKALRTRPPKALGGEIEKRAARLVAAPATMPSCSPMTARCAGRASRRPARRRRQGARTRAFACWPTSSSPARRASRCRRGSTSGSRPISRSLLGPLVRWRTPKALTGIARGLAYQIAEALGVLERSRSPTTSRGSTRRRAPGCASSACASAPTTSIVPALLKPAPRALAAQLWALKHGGPEVKGLDDMPHLAASGRTSIPGRQGGPQGPVPGRWLPRLRRARRARRHPGAAGRSDPSGASPTARARRRASRRQARPTAKASS